MTTNGPFREARISQHAWETMLERVNDAATSEQLGRVIRETCETKAYAKQAAETSRLTFNRLALMDKTVADLKEWREDSAVIEIAALRGKVRRNDKWQSNLNYALLVLLAGALAKAFLHP